MATVTAQNIISKVRIILQDPDAVRWDDDELLGWLNDAQREIVLLKPDASSVAEDLSLPDIGETRFSIDNAGISLIDIVRNKTGSKRAIRQINREILDAQKQEWHSSIASGTVQYFIFDDRNPRSFLVYPPSDGTATVEVIYSKSPASVTLSAVIGLDDIYANVIADYILYRAYSKDAEYAANGQRAMAAYASFAQSLGLKAQAETLAEPRNAATAVR